MQNRGVATFLLLYSSITFTVCEGKLSFPLLLFRSSVFRVSHASHSYPTFYCTKTWYHLYISDAFSWPTKMQTALFNLVWNTQKSNWTIFFDCPDEMFLSIEKVFALPYCFSPHFLDKGVTFLLSYNLRNITKQKWHEWYNTL